MGRTDPFTRTPGIAGRAFINMHYADKIIESFEDDTASKYVYKITGLRGSGKSVEYGKIICHFESKEKWLVYALSAAGNPTETLIAGLSSEPFIDSFLHSTRVSVGTEVGADIRIAKGNANANITKESTPNLRYYSSEDALTRMVKETGKNGYNILVGIDDISKTEDMVKFLSIWGKLLIEKQRIYLVCTGLANNIEEFSNEPSLTFFKRSDSVETGLLDKFEIASMYRKLLELNEEESVKLAKFVKGYAYAYQVLGSLYFEKKENETLEDIIPDFDKILSQDSYDLIWQSLTGAEKELARIIMKSSGQVSEIKSMMKNPASLDTLRDRLIKKHLVNSRQRGMMTIDLPRFKECISLWDTNYDDT